MFEKTTRPNRRQAYQLKNATIRPLSDTSEVERWNGLVSRFHYLRSSNIPGKAIRYVVEVAGEWAALLSFSSAAYHLADRDSFIGWKPWQRKQRLELLACNSRFLVLASSRRLPNLASKSLSLALKRLPADWLERFGCEPVAIETFVDPELFEGTCYKAANWTEVGSSKGFSRHAADFYEPRGKPKTILTYPLRKDFRELLCAAELPEPYHGYCQAGRERYPRFPGGKPVGSLMDGLSRLEDPRERKGQRYALCSLLAAVVCGYFAGCRSIEQCAAFASSLDQRQRRCLRFWRNPRTGKLEAPSHATLWRAVSRADPDSFDQAVEGWLAGRRSEVPEAVCIDGKVIRATATGPNQEVLSVSATSHRQEDFFSAASACAARTTSRKRS